MAEHSIVHASFTLERTLETNVERVFKAFADKTSKEKWFKGPGSNTNSHTMDFKVGGHESNSGKFPDGMTHRFEATYYDIVPSERIIYTYEMYLNGKRISVSLAVVELESTGSQTKLTLTENGVFLDGLDSVDRREQGTNGLLNALESSLKED
jgi:uncharacterized protein YndB with AHSA1/START domain